MVPQTGFPSLEADVQRLQDRLRERAGGAGTASSAPDFELSEVEVGEQISQGGFSIVSRGFWCGTPVALKRLFDPSMSEENFAEFDNEVQKLEQLRHPQILTLLAVHRKPPQLSMITELVEGGSLFELVHTPAKFSHASGPLAAPPAPAELLRITGATAGALTFLHARNVIHRDIKSHNVLLSPHLEVKLCDFGLARMRSELMTGTMQFAGTPNYMAPEIFENRKYTEKVDVFAYGTLLWEVFAADVPFACLDPVDIKEKVIAGSMPEMTSSIPAVVRPIILDCWTLDPSTRPCMADVERQIRAAPTALTSSGRPRRPNTATGAGSRVAAQAPSFGGACAAGLPGRGSGAGAAGLGLDSGFGGTFGASGSRRSTAGR
eukprot:TRINITY_DN5471_c0_g3_i1.p1 TRINITY_DN5471_c0_g3~~TRINITY_DN5471_c0_g3_i1.p1  ORF type:complete len:377 (+),score=76.47 TRINITY_DN5471_c0_g3_i1:120-1250(+)